MSIEFEVNMTDKIMYDFLLYHSYTSASGLFATLVGGGCFIFAVNKGLSGDSQSAILFAALGAMLLFSTPFTLKSSAKNQVKNTEMFQKPLQYEVTEKGITVTQDGESAENTWDHIMRVVSTSKSLVIYITRVRAIILPKEAMGDDYPAVVELISKNVPAKKVKIRHVSVR